MSTDPKIWIAAFVTLAIYSTLWRDNPFYRFFEFLCLGIGLGHSMVLAYQNVIQMGFTPLRSGKWEMAIPLLLGLSLYTRWSKSHSYLSRSAMGFIMGAASAVAFRGALQTDFFGQIIATAATPLSSVNSLVMVIGTFTSLAYFLFILTGYEGGTMGKFANITRKVGLVGQGTLMVAFGSAFAYTIMGRVSVAIGRFQFLFKDWIHLIE